MDRGSIYQLDVAGTGILGYVPNSNDNVVIGNSARAAILDYFPLRSIILRLTAGTLDVSAKSLTVTGNWINNGGPSLIQAVRSILMELARPSGALLQRHLII